MQLLRGALQDPISGKTASLLVIVILLGSFAVYFNAFYNGFVWDDLHQVVENHWIRDIKHIPEIFAADVWHFRSRAYSSNYYRPLMHVFYTINYSVFGLKPWGFHLVNIMFHAGNSILVFFIASKLFMKSQFSAFYSSLSFIAAVLFATHPIHTEAVTWVASLPEVSFAFFFLLSFYFYIKPEKTFGMGYVFSVLAFFLAALCKETALTLPIIIIVYDFLFGKAGEQPGARLNRYIPYFMAAGVYFVLRVHALGTFAPLRPDVGLSSYQHAINVFPLFAQYLGKLFFPVNLNAFHVFHPVLSILEPEGLLSVCIAVCFCASAMIAWKKNKAMLFSLLLIAVPLLPVLYIPVVSINAFAERYLYLPSFGCVIFLALFFAQIAAVRPRQTKTLALVLVAIVTLFSLGTVKRNTVWKDNYVLWTDTVKKSPDGAVPNENLGFALLERGQIDEAIGRYQIALKMNPYSIDSYNSLGKAYARKGLLDEAIRYFEFASTIDPSYADTHANLALAYEEKGLMDKAIEQYQIYVNLFPYSAEAYINLGQAYGRAGLPDKAIESFLTAIMLQPNDAVAHYNLGIVYREKGALDKAIEQLEIAVNLDPTDPGFRSNLAKAYAQKRLTR